MSKVNTWKKKMNIYYADLTPHQFSSDLNKAGFTVGARKHNSQNIGYDLAKSEVAATTESDSPLISEDGSIAVKLK